MHMVIMNIIAKRWTLYRTREIKLLRYEKIYQQNGKKWVDSFPSEFDFEAHMIR